MTIEQRIEGLEKRCKRLGKTLVGVGTLALFCRCRRHGGVDGGVYGRNQPIEHYDEFDFPKG